ncbi:hypothetical protein AC628_04340 [Bradyrhizobium sp. NAS96.2]|nr:hypothetical protein AC628_04340 [Bradyrhizobium sp. NAS96.2]
MPRSVEFAEPRRRILTYLRKRPIDEVETFQQSGDVFQTSTTLKIKQAKRHDWRVAVADLGMGKPEEHLDSGWHLSNSIEKVRSLGFCAGNQARRRRSGYRPCTENRRYLLLKPETNGSRGALDLLGIKHYACHR